jgi:signal peptidase I
MLALILGGLALAACLPLGWIAFIRFVAQPVRNQGTGMAPTYNDGDRLLLDKTRHQYERGDVVVFHYPRDPSKSFIKRIVGLPGEEISIRQGTTYINGVALDEPYIAAEFKQNPSNLEPEVVPPGHYFVMGDNRDHSNDSRMWGSLPQRSIYAVVLGRYG